MHINFTQHAMLQKQGYLLMRNRTETEPVDVL